jgi:predicted secreted protein
MISALFALMLIAEEPLLVSAPADAQKPKKEKKICRVDEAQTGTRLQKKTCLTKSQWEERAHSNRTDDLKLIGVSSKETGARPVGSQ